MNKKFILQLTKLHQIVIILFTIFAIHSCSVESTNPESPSNLRVQGYNEQIGIDLANPCFAWYVNDKDRGEYQTAYRILVASSEEKLNANNGDIWDSGKVQSMEQYGIRYEGSKLESNTNYFWKVMTWDKDDKQSPWSENKKFSTGFLNPSEWTASWITSAEITPSIPYMVRKQFNISKAINYGIINISGVGNFELRLNGNKVGDHELDPGWTEYTKSQQYVSFDVTSLLKEGENVIGVWLADGFMDLRNPGGRYMGYWEHSDGPKRMIAELVIRYSDGSVEKIISDETWKTSFGPITFSNIFGGEDYDARKEKDGWDTAGYNDSDWKSVIKTNSPGGILKSQSQPPVKIVEVLTPSSKNQKEDTIEVVFDKTFAGNYEVSLSGKPGQSVIIRMYDGTNVGWGNEHFNTYCQYTLKGEGIETFKPKFYYWGLNKLIITGASLSQSDTLPQLHDAKGYVLSASAKQTGNFNSSDEMYNHIFAINRQGITSNLYSSITDCPHREKAAWMNDINFTLPSFTAIYDMSDYIPKIIQDIAESQHEEGWILSRSPNYREPIDSSNPFTCSPFYDITSMRFPWTMYQQYGDKQVLQEQYDVAKTSLAYLTSKSSGYLIDYGLGDWLSPNKVEREFIETCVYYDFVHYMAKWAEVIEKPEDVNYYNTLSTNIKEAFNKKYFNYSTHNYGTQQTANSVPLYHGMYPEGEEQNVFDALIKSIEASNYTINCGQNAHGYMLQVLSRYGRDDIVGRIHTNKNGPSFGHWVTIGKTNTPENWDGSLSQQHHMNDAFPEWLCNNLAGISPLTPGFDTVRIRPTSSTTYVPEMVSYSLETLKGVIISNWKRGKDSYELEVTIPTNCRANVHVPTFGLSEVSISEGKNNLWKNGSATNQSKDIQYIGLDGEYPSNNNYVIFDTGSGNYKFKVKW